MSRPSRITNIPARRSPSSSKEGRRKGRAIESADAKRPSWHAQRLPRRGHPNMNTRRHAPAHPFQGRDRRLRARRLYRGHLCRPRQPRAGAVRRRRRGRRAHHPPGRAADDHHRGGELPGLPEGGAGPRADGAVQGAGRAVRHHQRDRRRDRGRPLRSPVPDRLDGRRAAAPTRSSSPPARRPSGWTSRRRRNSRTTAYPPARPATGRCSRGAIWSSSAAATRRWRRRTS